MSGTQAAEATPRADGVIAVRGALTFESVPDVLVGSAAWFEQASGPITVDLADVERADSAGVALLVEWQRLGRAKRREVRFINVPEQMQSLIRVNGLSEALG